MPQASWTEEERAALAALDTPARIQDFLDATPYTTDHQTRSPRRVLRDRCAHCTEGAIFAAAALRFHGRPPLIMDLRAENDDDHVITVYQWRGRWGSVAKSNFAGLRYREPIFRNARELALSYFEEYFNTLGEKSLRAYSRPFDLSALDDTNWMTTERDLEFVGMRLDRVRHYPLLDAEAVRNMRPVDRRMYDAGFLGTDMAGVYIAKERES
jgi:hypothetical protein